MKKVKANKDGSISFRNRAELSKYIRQGIEKRLQQFADRFYKLIDCIDEENVDWGDLGKLYGKYLEEKC